MNIRLNVELDMQSFVDVLHRSEFDTYTPEQLDAFRKGISCALFALGADELILSDFRERFESLYCTDTAEEAVCPF